MSSPTMSTEASLKGKGAKVTRTPFIPLVLVTSGDPTVSFKEMAAMDELEHT